MKLKVFSVLDSKAGAFGTPFFMVNQAVALRAFEQSAQDETHMFCKHPSDFILYELGEFEDTTGLITSHPQTLHLAVASQFRVGSTPIPTTLLGAENEKRNETSVLRRSEGGNSKEHIR